MKFGMLVQTGTENRSIMHSALQFATALLAADHSIERIFFYGAGVTVANSNTVSPQDESDIPSSWQTFILEHRLDAVVCIAAALQRGVLDSQEAIRYQKSCPVLRDGFVLGGLGQAVELFRTCDRVVSF